jgi:Flp pilus assembly secretin CpaC
MKLKQTVALGLSALILGTSAIVPAHKAFAADLVRGFSPYQTPDFLKVNPYQAGSSTTQATPKKYIKKSYTPAPRPASSVAQKPVGDEPVAMAATEVRGEPEVSTPLPRPKKASPTPFPVAPKRYISKAPVRPVAPRQTPRVEGMVLQSGISATVNDVELTVGRAKIVNLRLPAARVAISDPEIANAVIISPTQIQLIGKSVGVANLILWDSDTSDDHTIIDLSVHRDVSVLAKQLQFVDPRIHIEPLAAEDSVILTGEADSPESAQLAVELAKAFFVNTFRAQGGAGGAGGGGGGGGNAAGGGGNARRGLSSLAPGSSLPFPNQRVINMIKVEGEPTTKLQLARKKLQELDPNIKMDLIPGPDGEKVILTGRVATGGLISKAINTAAIFYGKPGMQVLTGPGGKMTRPTGSPAFQTSEAFNDNLDVNVMQGQVITDATGNVVSMLEVAQRPQVRCSIKFLTVQRAALKQLGSSFQDTFGDVSMASFSGVQSPLTGRQIATFYGAGSNFNSSVTGAHRGHLRNNTASLGHNIFQDLGSGVTQVFSINQRMLLALSALEEKRKLRSLAEPNITMLSGEKASFLAGGEVPIPVLGTNGNISITYHEFGIRLNVIATVTDDGKVHMQVAPEVSTVDPSNAVTTNIVTVPGFATRRMQTTMELEDGQSFVLAGLFSQEDNDILNKFPGIGSIPIIGAFFSGKNADRRDSEMIVIIRPEIVNPPGGISQASMSAPPSNQKAHK